MIISLVLSGFSTISRLSLICLMLFISDCSNVFWLGRSFPLDSHQGRGPDLSSFVAREVVRSTASCSVASSMYLEELRVGGNCAKMFPVVMEDFTDLEGNFTRVANWVDV